MIVGQGNYVFARGKRKSKVFFIRDYGGVALIDVGRICFPKHCVGKRVRVKVEFVEDKNDKNDKL
jgi:hypothetical protein